MAVTVGVVGLGVMGANLARNLASRGYSVVGYDFDDERVGAVTQWSEPSRRIIAVTSLELLVQRLESPRVILLMVPAGAAVDGVIQQLRPWLSSGDIVLDGGNSFFQDTDRRFAELATAGVHYLGVGVSGGEEGALRGPAVMAGGSREAWNTVGPILTTIAARADDGAPCAAFVGPKGAGHYTKMVHNGIEYGDMQLIAEVYDVLHRGAGMTSDELADVFEEWNRGPLRSYLIEITARVLRRVDGETNRALVDVILDEAEHKGTGRWMSQEACHLGVPVPTINAAVESRMMSAIKPERVRASKLLRGPSSSAVQGPERSVLVATAEQALFASKITSYAQGLSLLATASASYGYGIDRGLVATIWRAGCIIRAAFLSDVRAAFQRDPALPNLMVDDAFTVALSERQNAWRAFVEIAVSVGIPVPAISASLAYYDAYRSATLPANVIQAQRDYFGAHRFRRVDRPGVFHEDWTEQSSTAGTH